MSDLIDRQAAVEVVDAIWIVTGDKNVAKAWQQIKDLPTIEPTGEMVDLYCKRRCLKIITEELYLQLTQGKYNPPSLMIKPKRGKWEEKSTFGIDESGDQIIQEWQSARCSVCGRYHTTPYMYYFDIYNYCPNCGAKMRGETNG